MFINKETKQEEEIKYPTEYSHKTSSHNFIFFGVIAILFIFILLIVYLLYGNTEKIKVNTNNNQTKTTATTSKYSKLPDYTNNKNSELNLSTSTENIKIEDLTFGHFYEETKDDFEPTLSSYSLPVDIKEDAANYYNLSRKIDFDQFIEEVNKDGFTIFDNPYNKSQDFFSVYRELINRDIPIVLSSDFIFYYYQNELKHVYKEIEKNIFYENVWNINKKLFDIALMRYKKRLSEVGLINDPVLEGARLELVYLTVGLSLLAPEIGQINDEANLVNENKFSEQEAEEFNFIMPGYIKNEVEKEVLLIKEAKKKEKSPVFLYERDYKYFVVPENYSHNAKLNNFYLNLKWFNSVFPLYYLSEDCPDCLLDYNDWLINFVAASFLAKDISDNQDIKNQWAMVYKFISFFSGLRANLTYIQYDQALKEIFGQDYKIEEIFSIKNRKDNLVKLQKKIEEFEFAPIEGGVNSEKVDKINHGLRLLQEPFWPNDYILEELSDESFVFQRDGYEINKILTGCKPSKNSDTIYRCTGFGMDIINLLYPVDIKDDKFELNTDYYNYENKLDSIKEDVEKFNVFTWNHNIYWSTLDTAKNMLVYSKQNLPSFMKTEKWQNEKDVNSVLGTWVNLHLAEETIDNYQETTNGSRFGAQAECNKYNFIEPKLDLFNDLIAKNKMLIKMMVGLNVADKTSAASGQLKKINNKLEQIIKISKKELSGEKIDDNDCEFIIDFASEYEVVKAADKNYSIKIGDKILNENIEGVKLLMIYYKNYDKNILAIGPIFNYKESAKNIIK